MAASDLAVQRATGTAKPRDAAGGCPSGTIHRAQQQSFFLSTSAVCRRNVLTPSSTPLAHAGGPQPLAQASQLAPRRRVPKLSPQALSAVKMF